MATSLSAGLDYAGQSVIYDIVGLIVQTFVFGAYSILIALSTRMLLVRKLTTRVNRVMFGITTFMYLLSAAYWVYSIANGVDRINGLITLGNNPSLPLPPHTEVTQWSPLFNALVLINYCLSDGVVVWRAWVICLHDHRKYLWITVFFLAVTAITVALTIAFRIAGTIVAPIQNLPSDSVIGLAIEILQLMTLFSSLLSNLTATGVLNKPLLTRRHYRLIRSAFSKGKDRTRSSRILLLIVESGVLYCIAAILAFVSSVIRLPHGTLNDLYTPVNIQLAGAYPSIVLLLVGATKLLNESAFDEDLSFSHSLNTSQPMYLPSPGASSTADMRSGRSENPMNITFASNPDLSQSSINSRIDSMVLDISREKVEQKGRQSRFSDVSFV
ncbi:hypothetical protein GGX14DRAFT_597785 [Mycena pura]|uniref:Uncharacterized protein n=1 Tax=Mycena pura TaxID=153505 RepID=A0AAD6VV81_9AGAR|nr:hypothetical protein GGX14DRAFT_597785 [Mycena pura]